MRSRLAPGYLLAFLFLSLSAAAQNDPIGKTPLGDTSDLGVADPLNAIEGKRAKDLNAQDPKTMPELKDATPGPSGMTKSSPPSADAEPESADVPPPEIMAPTEKKDVAPLPPPTTEPPVVKMPIPAEPPPPEIAAPTPAPVATPRPPAPEIPKAIARPVPKERQPDDPDFRRENIFHTVYQKYNSQPTPLESWDQAAGAKKSETYKVQKGDTLWDLSKTLFGDANYWPKVWALNADEVTNPHEIETWMQIRFYPGDLNNPPTVAVTDTVTATEKPQSLIPPPKRSQPIVRTLPDSLPVYRYAVVNRPPPDFSVKKASREPASKLTSLTYYALESASPSVGTIKETEMGLETAGEFQYVFVELPDSKERLFTVTREIGKFMDGNGGHLIEVQGEVEVIEPVSEKKNLYRAIVRKNLTPIEVGSVLIPGPIATIPTEDGDVTPTSQTLQIVGSAMNTGRRMVDAAGIVFVNGGSSAGLQVDMILPIFSNVRLRVPDTDAESNDRMIGHLRVVRVSEHYATCLLTQISDDILVGDSVGGSRSAPNKPAQDVKPPEPSEGAMEPSQEQPGSELDL